MDTLQQICKPIESDLQEFEVRLQEKLKSDVELLDTVIHYVLQNQGKRFRPILVLLTAQMTGKVTADSIHGAIMVELLHTATLIHDDVVDESDTRRGHPTIHKVWQNKVAILTGDYLFAKALISLVDVERLDAIRILSQAATRMSEGELLQIERRMDYKMNESIYYKLVSDKTASLISAACQLGAVTSSDRNNGDVTRKMSDFGEYLGIAFQIKDDLLDYTGDENKIGKPVAKDILENKITLPLIYALKNSDQKQSEQIIKIINDSPSAKDIDTIRKYVITHGGIDFAKDKARQYADQAVNILDAFPNSPYKASLNALSEFVMSRES
ncbi:polyprenyl synthetase family protein [candidate division KSB1 bacterium]|nr:polyprenyl synthetase family protein [candidate division KSB1 bacterium]